MSDEIVGIMFANYDRLYMYNYGPNVEKETMSLKISGTGIAKDFYESFWISVYGPYKRKGPVSVPRGKPKPPITRMHDEYEDELKLIALDARDRGMKRILPATPKVSFVGNFEVEFDEPVEVNGLEYVLKSYGDDVLYLKISGDEVGKKVLYLMFYIPDNVVIISPDDGEEVNASVRRIIWEPKE